MKEHVREEHQGYAWIQPPLQEPEVELLCSVERPCLPAVHGTATPPSGLSGWIRRAAFRHSEDRYRHWLPLMLADRVSMVEGVLEDVVHGRLPNLASEMGWRMLWKHNRARVVTRVAMGAALLYAFHSLRSRSNDATGQPLDLVGTA
jgi:hypothetical protein